MRSSNTAVAQVAWIVISVLYGLVGVVGGLWWLIRQDAVLWGGAATWGATLGVLMSLATLSSFPLQWMSFDTALSPPVFYANFAVGLVVNGIYLYAIALLSMAAAEGLGRLACIKLHGFDHQQLFATVSHVAASPTVTRQMVKAYLLVPVMFAYEVLFYLTAVNIGGWWTPSSPLIDPNVAAMTLPSVAAIGQSLFAGVWEVRP